MRLYHGSLAQVNKPEIRDASHTLDYGKGFYTTTSYEQAAAWAVRKKNMWKSGRGYVNIYEFDVSAMGRLKSLTFSKPTEMWVDFVMQNRTVKGFLHDYDIVHGPVANDRVYAAFALYEGGILNKQELIQELRAYKLVDQYLFHTEQALQALTFIEAKEVGL